MSHWRRAVIVGASSGIGEAVARELAQQGTDVVLIARREDVLQRIAAEIEVATGSKASTYPCDVRDPQSSSATFADIAAALPFDLIVYSSGVMPKGSGKGYPTEEDLNAIETNFAGAVVWLNAAAEYFIGRGSGTIVGIGSVAGDRGRRGNPVYNATKAALAIYLESLRARLASTNVKVVTIKPGFVRTPLIGSRRVFPPAATPEVAAHQILMAAKRGRRTAYVPWWWAIFGLLVRHMPAPVMERLPV